VQETRIELAGYVVSSLETRYMPSGTKVANARLGETYRYQGKDGKQISHTNWHSLTFYDELADAAVNTCRKGDNLFVEGSVQQRQFTPTDGVKRTVHEIVVRSFHVIMPSRSSSAESAGEPIGTFGEEQYDSDWPVGPA
jgi:single-strand DNA-binding protein